jgi:hypothetical protein
MIKYDLLFAKYYWLSPSIIGQFIFVTANVQKFDFTLHQQGTTEGDL